MPKQGKLHRLTLFGHIMRMDNNTDAKRILLVSPPADWRRQPRIIAVSLGCFVILCTSSFRTNWYHLTPSSMRRHHWSSAFILRASVLDITQQSGILVRCAYGTASTSLRWRAVTSKSDFLSSAWQHEWRHFGGWCHKCFRLMSG